jgi:hypothetical protein
MYEHKLNDNTVERFHQRVQYPLWTEEELEHIYRKIKNTNERTLINFGLACWDTFGPCDYEMNPDNWVAQI